MSDGFDIRFPARRVALWTSGSSLVGSGFAEMAGYQEKSDNAALERNAPFNNGVAYLLD